MTAVGQSSFGCKAESTYGTPVTVDRFYPLIEDGIEPEFGTVDAEDEMYAGALVTRQSSSDPYIVGVSGSLKMYVPTKGFGLLLSHALGSSSVGTVTDLNYTQTHVLSATGKYGKSLTGQSIRPFNPSGTQQFTWHGLKITSLELSIEEEGFLQATVEVDGEDVDTSTAAAVVAYPTIALGAAKFPWRLASFTIGGANTEIKNFRCKVTWPMNVDRRYLRGSALKKEPTVSGKPTIEWEAEVDFADLTQYNRYAAATIGSRVAALVLTCDGPLALAGTTVPRLTVSIPAARFDGPPPTVSGDEPLMMTLSGIGLDDDTNEPITVTYRTNDSAV